MFQIYQPFSPPTGCFVWIICFTFIWYDTLLIQLILLNYIKRILTIVRGDENGFHLEDGQGGRSYLGFENLQGVLKGKNITL